MEHFITAIHINHVRHLKDIDIPLSSEKRQHLILTGRNGSGKTSVLDALKWYLYLFPLSEVGLSSFIDRFPVPLSRHSTIEDLNFYIPENWMNATADNNEKLSTLLGFSESSMPLRARSTCILRYPATPLVSWYRA